MIKSTQQIGIGGTYINTTEAIQEKPAANIMINEGRLKAFPLRSDTRQGCPLSPRLFSIVPEVLEQSDTHTQKNPKN